MDTLTLARSFASLLLDTAAKGTVLLLLACLAAWLCRRSSAALRHSIWCMTMGGLLVLPVASWALPAWQIPILPPEPLPASVAEAVRLSTPAAEPVIQGATGEGFDSPVPRHSTAAPTVFGQDTFKDTGGPERPPVAPSAPPVVEPMPTSAPALVEPVAEPLTTIEWTSLLVSASWLLGVSLFGVLLLVGLWRTVKLRRTSLRVADGEWPGMLVELRQRLGLSRSVELREHAESVVPLTWGIWRPVVLLPKLARKWDEPMRRAVLLHELAHVQRGDVACQVLGRLTCVLYWFHPLAWFALRQLRQEREQACDDAVVGTGEKASDYAEQLLQVARLCCAPRGLSLGVAMAEGSSLERRVKSLFDSARSHGPLTRRVALALFAIGGAILAGLAPIEPTASQAERDAKTPGLVGLSALEQMELLKPKFGDAKRGIQLGVAFASPSATTYALGERIPMVLFFRNAGQEEVTFQVHFDFMAYPPSVVNEDGQKQSISSLLTFIDKPTRTITLKPDEVYSVETYGLGLGKKQGAPSFESPVDGKYTIEFSEGIFWNLNDPQEKWSEGLTSGTLEFEVTSGLLGQQTVLIPQAASNLDAADAKAPFPTARQAIVSIATEKPAPEVPGVSNPAAIIQGAGAGFIVNASGYIVTAKHVVDGARKIRVKLYDGTELPASVAGADPKTDLAVLLIHTAQPLTVMPEQHQVQAKVGDEVTAIGNAWGHSNTISRGVVTGLNRDVELSETQKYTNLIQTDAANDPGYSGGPLLNAQGEAIGINIAFRAGDQKVAFAMPITEARKAYVNLMSRVISGPAAKEQMELLKPVFGEAKRGIQLGLAVGSLERTFPQGGRPQFTKEQIEQGVPLFSEKNPGTLIGREIAIPPDHGRIPLWLFYRNLGDKELTFHISHDFMNDPPTVTDANGKRVQVNFVMHWMFIAPLKITLQPGEVWCIATPGLYLGARMPSIKPVAGKYKLTYPQGIWDVNTTRRLNTDLPFLPTGTPDISGLLKADPKQPVSNALVGQVVETPNWSEQLNTGVIEFEIAPGKNGQPEARLLAAAETPVIAHGSAPGTDAPVFVPVGANPPETDPTIDPAKVRYRGMVFDATMNVVPGADIYLLKGFDQAKRIPQFESTHTDADGRFEFTLPKADRDAFPVVAAQQFVVWKSGQPLGVGAVIANQVGWTPVTLPELSPATIRFVLENGQPAKGVQVIPDLIRDPSIIIPHRIRIVGTPLAEELAAKLTQTTDQDGRVTFPELSAGILSSVRVVSPTHGMQRLLIRSPEVELSPVASVEGVFLGGLPNSQLMIGVKPTDENINFTSQTVTTDTNGRFSISQFPAGPFVLQQAGVVRETFLQPSTQELKPGENRVEITTIPGIPIRGRVVVCGTDQPVEGAAIAIASGVNHTQHRHATTDAQGNFSSWVVSGGMAKVELAGLTQPNPELVIGQKTSQEEIPVPSNASEVTVTNLEVSKARIWRGKLIDSQGQPIDNAIVAAFQGELLEPATRTVAGGQFLITLPEEVNPVWHTLASPNSRESTPTETVSTNPLVIRKATGKSTVPVVQGAGIPNKEEQIYQALESPTTLEFNNAPLREVLEKIADQHGVAIVVEAEGLKEVGLDSNSPINISVKDVRLSSALKLMLEPLKLSYVVENDVLNITSQERIAKTGPLLLRGRVLDAKQRPVEEALLVFPCFMKESAGTVPHIFRTHSGRDGEFMIKIPRETVELASFSNHSLIWCQKDGHGLGAAQIFTALSSEPLTVKLPALAPVEFVVQSDQGAPLHGVRVEVEMTRVPAWDGGMDNQQGSVGRVPEELKPFVTKVSDADGKVILDTIPRDRHYGLKMTSEQYGVQHFQDPRKYLKLLPVAPVTGKLSNGQAGVKLNFNIPHQYAGSYIEASAEAITDGQGNFSLPKFPVGPVKITSPDLQGPMFLEATEREVVAGGNNSFDLQVTPGIRVRGRVMLEKPRRGIRKAVVGFSSDDGGKPVVTDENGNYTAFVRPQPTIATYFGGSSGEPFQLIGSGLVLSGASVQVPEGATEVTLPDIVLAEGLTLSGQLLDENQNPVSGVFVSPFPAALPLSLKTGPTGNFGAIVRADKRPSGWVVGWDSPPEPSFIGQPDSTTWAKVISQEPLILQVSRKSQPERVIPYSEIDMDAPVPMEQVVWGEVVDGWQPGFWLKSTGEPTNQQVPLNALVTYRLLLRNTSDKGRDVVFRKGPDVPYVIPSSQLAQALTAGELPQEYQSEVSKFVYKGVSDHVIFIAAGESLLLYGSDTSTQAGLFVGVGDDSPRYSRLATVAQPGKNWIVQPLMVQTLTPEERTQLEESLKSERSRSHWDMTMLDRNGQPRKETAKTATPRTKGMVGIPLTRFQTLYAKIERDVGTLVAAVPEAPETPKKAPEEIQASLDSFPWSEAIGGLQTCILSGDSPDAPGIAEMNEMLAYGVTVRNPTDKRLDFLVRIELPYLVPEERMQGELSSQFRAEPLSSAPRMQESIYRLSLEPGESVFLPGMNAERFPDTAVSLGDAMGTMPDEEGDFPRIATVHVGTNWLVQPLTIQMLTAAESETIKSLPGEFEIMKVDAKGKPSDAKVSLVEATLTGKTVVAKQRVEVATRSFLTEQHADDVTWGRIDKGLQCGIKLRNPQESYKVGDTLEAETLWRNSSDAVISTTRPRQLDLYPIIQDAEGNAKLIDFGARFDLLPGDYDYQPGEVVSLGISKITLVAEGTPSPKSNMEPGQITLEPGKYQLIGNGGVGNINPRSGSVEFAVVGASGGTPEPAVPANTKPVDD